MKTFIIAALTADGFIAKDTNHAAMWTSKEDKARFVKLTKEAGIVVMGRTTYETLPRPLKDRRNIVYTRSPLQPVEGIEFTQESPVDLIERLTNESADKSNLKIGLNTQTTSKTTNQAIAICGGSKIYTVFMKAGLVDKLYLTIEPIIFGSGIPLFSEPLDYKLKLITTETTPSGSILLEYDVIE